MMCSVDWQPRETAPYNEEVEVRAGSMTFLAMLVPDGSLDEALQPCDQWQATKEGDHPPCWSGGACWASNEYESPSLQVTAWRRRSRALAADARRAETRSGSVEDEDAAGTATPNPSEDHLPASAPPAGATLESSSADQRQAMESEALREARQTAREIVDSVCFDPGWAYRHPLIDAIAGPLADIRAHLAEETSRAEAAEQWEGEQDAEIARLRARLTALEAENGRLRETIRVVEDQREQYREKTKAAETARNEADRRLGIRDERVFALTALRDAAIDRAKAAEAALKPFAEFLSDREQAAHEALQVGGYVPLDEDFEVEVPLAWLYAARTALPSPEPTGTGGNSPSACGGHRESGEKGSGPDHHVRDPDGSGPRPSDQAAAQLDAARVGPSRDPL